MPIYAYKCSSCGHADDALQKINDAPLTTCPACKQETYIKQLTAAGFQLKGGGWYVTDFRSGSSATAPAADKPEKAASSAGHETTKGDTQTTPAAAPAAAPAADTSSNT